MHSDYLYIVAEIGAAFAGFAGLVGAITRRGDRSREQEEFDFYLFGPSVLLFASGVGFVRLFQAMRPSEVQR